ncbi:MAG: formylglycine-generating enzyme family protein [Cyanobacteria bacterium P01_F01_bin.143]
MRNVGWEYESKVYPGNYGKGSKGIYREQATSVGYFQIANNWGLYDMHGNIWEWCEDDWHNNYKNAPIDGTAWLSKESSSKVMRSGSWGFSPSLCRSAIRYSSLRGARHSSLGFRVVCVVPRT